MVITTPLPSGTSGNQKPQCRAALPQRPSFWAQGEPLEAGPGSGPPEWPAVRTHVAGAGASEHELLDVDAYCKWKQGARAGLGSPLPHTVPSTLLGSQAIATFSSPRGIWGWPAAPRHPP